MEISKGEFEKVKANTRELEDNGERYKTLVEGIYDYAVFTTDPQGFISSWNPGAIRIKQYETHEAIGQHFSMLYPQKARENDEPMDHLHDALKFGSYREQGLRQKKNGDLFMADVYIRPIFKNGRHIGFAKVVADLDEQNKLMDEVSLAKNEVNDLKVERSLRENFISSLSHDIRTPLAIARLSAEYLLLRPGSLDKNCKNCKRIIRSIDSADRMIRDLLDASKLKIGDTIPLHIESCNLIEIAKEVIEGHIENGNYQINIKAGEDIRGYWDPEGIRRIIENLVNNAIKYGDTLRPIEILLEHLKNDISIQVHNYGSYINPEDQRSIFDQFKRVLSKENVNKDGWGIGLNLVKGLVSAHHGKISVKSYPRHGTTFIVELPQDSRNVNH